MGGVQRRVALLAGGVVALFGAIVAILVRVVPGPLGATDYLVIGAVGTFAALGLVFAVLISGWIKGAEASFKRRKG